MVNVPADAGTSQRWGEWVILQEPPEETVVLDLSEVRFADPLFLLRLRGFIDWHTSNGHPVRIMRPRNTSVGKYLARMSLANDLPDNCECDLESVAAARKNDVLIPIRRLASQADSDALDDELGALYTAHFTGNFRGFAEAFTRTVGEMCDNATTHGKSNVGVAYVTAQRYKDRCVLAIGDLGVGIPEHMRSAFPNLVQDEDAIREATLEGVTATGNPHRGIGYQYVIDGLKESAVAGGELRVWSGYGRFRVVVRGGVQIRRRAWQIEHPTAGTWVRLDLSAR